MFGVLSEIGTVISPRVEKKEPVCIETIKDSIIVASWLNSQIFVGRIRCVYCMQSRSIGYEHEFPISHLFYSEKNAILLSL